MVISEVDRSVTVACGYRDLKLHLSGFPPLEEVCAESGDAQEWRLALRSTGKGKDNLTLGQSEHPGREVCSVETGQGCVQTFGHLVAVGLGGLWVPFLV